MDILDRLGTVWPADYALQQKNSDERKTVIEIQQLKIDAFSEILILRKEVESLRAQIDKPKHYARGEGIDFELWLYNNYEKIANFKDTNLLAQFVWYEVQSVQDNAKLNKLQPTSQDSARLEWMLDWFMRGGKLLEVVPNGHMTPYCKDDVIAGIDAEMEKSK